MTTGGGKGERSIEREKEFLGKGMQIERKELKIANSFFRKGSILKLAPPLECKFAAVYIPMHNENPHH